MNHNKKDPNQIDLEQLAKLREFKDKTFPKALVESYNSQIEFRDKLAKQIEIQLRNLVAEESNSNNTADLGAREKIEIEFSDPKTGELLGSEINLEADFLDVSDIDDIPDYSSSQSDQDEDGEVKKIFRRSENRDYYRQYVEYVVKKSMYKNIGFSLKNNGVIGARDIFIDMDINVDGEVEELISNDRLELKVPKKEKDSSISFSLDDFGALASERLQLEGSDKDWNASFEIRALQPKRTVKSRQQFVVGAISDCVVNISAKIYADILPEPLIQSLKIDLKVNTIEAKSSEILQEIGYELEDCTKSA